MKTRNLIIPFILLLFGSSFSGFGQNSDLVSDKELQELNKLNPSLTGVLNRFRVLGNASSNVDIGLETRFFKTANRLGFYATFDNIDNLERKSYNLSYARDFELTEKIQWKLGANVDYQVKLFNGDKEVKADLSFKDFDGFEYKIDSADIQNFSLESKVFDLSVGTSILYKNLVLGVTLDHINTPDVSIQKGVKQLADMAYNAQLMGFFKLGSKLTIIPSAIYASQDEDVFSSFGMSLNYKGVSFNGQYEDLNGFQGYDFGISARIKEKHLINVSVRNDLVSASVGQSATIVSATINSSLFKKKKELEGVLEQIRLVY